MNFFQTGLICRSSRLSIFFLIGSPQVIPDFPLDFIDGFSVCFLQLGLHEELPVVRKVDNASLLVQLCHIFVQKESDDGAVDLAGPDLFDRSIFKEFVFKPAAVVHKFL